MANQSEQSTSSKSTQEAVVQEINVKGSQLVERVREIAEAGNARRITIKREGKTVMELPLLAGAGGAAAAVIIAPQLAAIGAFASLVSDVKVVIERRPDAAGEGASGSGKTSSPPPPPKPNP